MNRTMKNIIKTWLKDHQIELPHQIEIPDERIDILITMLKSESKGEIEITTFCNSGCDCPYCHTGEDDARDVEKCIYCQNNWANEEHNRLVKIALQQERERIIEEIKNININNRTQREIIDIVKTKITRSLNQ